jgi:hypothetical protein
MALQDECGLELLLLQREIAPSLNIDHGRLPLLLLAFRQTRGYGV